MLPGENVLAYYGDVMTWGVTIMSIIAAKGVIFG
jgi:hypothetical protein